MTDQRTEGDQVEVVAKPEPLTREAVLAMPAGREMDALVAERVLGWIWWTHRKGPGVRWLAPPDWVSEVRLRGYCSFPRSVADPCFQDRSAIGSSYPAGAPRLRAFAVSGGGA